LRSAAECEEDKMESMGVVVQKLFMLLAPFPGVRNLNLSSRGRDIPALTFPYFSLTF
jgi:hypothetical protein